MQTNFYNFVESLDSKQILELEKEIKLRKYRLKFNADNFEKLAFNLGRRPVCPKCKSYECIKYGTTKKFQRRYRCKKCGSIFQLMSSSIFNSIKKDMPTFYNFIVLLTYNVPLNMCKEILNISENTGLLWRHKIFETVDKYQQKTKLGGIVWIDEIYIDDPKLVQINGVFAGLSRNKICITLGIDAYKRVYAKLLGYGKPTKEKVYDAYKDVIVEGSTLIHDADKSHDLLMEKLHLQDKYYKACVKDKDYQNNMLLINSLCSWVQRYIYRYVGMKIKNLQRYLNWYVYLFKVKQAKNKWPKNERIIRHLIIDETKFVGKYKKKPEN